MISMIGAIARVAFVVIATTVCLPIAASRAQTYNFAYVSDTGTGSACTVAQPCGSLGSAFAALDGNNGRIVCLSPVNFTSQGAASSPNTSNQTVEIDCPAGMYSEGIFWASNVSNVTLKVRNVAFTNLGNASAIGFFGGGGTLILENCVVEASITTALDIEPTGALNLVIRNSRISNNASGILLKPAAGGSIKATLDHVVITGNSGGGIKSDSTNGIVNLDITDSEISNNAANGINLVGSANQNMLNLSRTVIAKNTLTGLQTNGASAAALVETTLFDTNASGATAVVNGGRILTYGNNRTVGSPGSGFTGTAPLN